MIPIAQQTPPTTIWAAPNGSTLLWTEIIVAFVLGFGILIALTQLPRNLRKPLVATVTFVGGIYFTMHWLWPQAQDYAKDQVPNNHVEAVSFWLQASLPAVMNLGQVLGALLLGLGISSLLRVHIGQLIKGHKDWFFSLTLLVCMLLMLVFGYWDWQSRLAPGAEKAVLASPRIFPNFAKDFLLDGLFINLDAVMYSMIAFFIFSAAYRSFRLRSAESTILLGTAVLVMLSLMGGVVLGWDRVIDALGGGGHGAFAAFMENLRLGAIKDWVQNNLQSPSIRAIEFGLAVGGLAMTLRLWLSIEKGVSL
jgi:ABC-type amino acid transport system permease subunit